MGFFGRNSIDILRLDVLRKSYGAVAAVDGVSFVVGPGEIVGLLGPNGAGKTTTINMVMGVLEPDSGAVSVEGETISSRRSWVLSRMNFAAGYAPLPGNLTVYQNLRVFSLLYSVPNARERIATLLGQFDLIRFRNVKCGTLSSGEQTRVSLAKALLNLPHLLLLDEPTASLDPATARHIRSVIRSYVAESRAGVLWTSHNMHEVAEVCDRVLLLSRGRILLGGNPKTLPALHGKKNLEDLFIAVALEPLSLEGVLP
ncbi:MAG: ABC transporter ATP-binding protein [Elusimicrobia bacterium]|nr:ABC transporter ATP-binding protein [Elusimicrobiota bacterium]